MKRLKRRAGELFETFLIGLFVAGGIGLMVHHYVTFN